MFESTLLAMQELVWFFIYEKWTGQALLLLFPFFILIELPMNLLVVAGILRWYSKKLRRPPFNSRYTPKVSCIITC